MEKHCLLCQYTKGHHSERNWHIFQHNDDAPRTTKNNKLGGMEESFLISIEGNSIDAAAVICLVYCSYTLLIYSFDLKVLFYYCNPRITITGLLCANIP